MPSPQAAADAGIFLMALAEAFNVYGALNSSPWTAENFGADAEKAKSCRRYVLQADVVNILLGIGSSLISESVWPLLGIGAITVYMHIMYERALKKGALAGTDGVGQGLMTYIPLGGRPVDAALDQSGLNPGGFYTAVFDDQVIGATVPRFELYHLYLRSTVLTGQATTVDVYLNTLPWDTTLIGQRNSWDPSQPALMQPGDVLYVCFNVPVTVQPPPRVVCWFRYEQS